jgi:saccharopine dehydrogenase (NADP+, L-glutamate forming)
MIHWLGLGLSSYVGVSVLSRPFCIWARDPERTSEILRKIGRADISVFKFSDEALLEALKPGDIVVSMLPASHHPRIAALCLQARTHLVTSSYISPEMQAMQDQAVAQGCVLLNEVGLDPGLDHLFAHEIFSRNKERAVQKGVTRFRFRSFCGGMPANTVPFRYRFSWSPAGVLKALQNPATWIENGSMQNQRFPFQATRAIQLRNESFEMLPNRDSTLYLEEYSAEFPGIPEEFLRGTLRPKGWSRAWNEILDWLKTGPENAELERYGTQLYQRHFYRSNEEDRVVLHLELEGFDHKGKSVLHDQIHLSQTGPFPYGSAMSQTVSIPVLIGVEEIAQGALCPGVHRMPSDPVSRKRWMQRLKDFGILSIGS